MNLLEIFLAILLFIIITLVPLYILFHYEIQKMKKKYKKLKKKLKKEKKQKKFEKKINNFENLNQGDEK